MADRIDVTLESLKMAERAFLARDDLAMMLRRMIHQSEKYGGPRMKALARQAKGLLAKHQCGGTPLRDEYTEGQ